MKATEQFFYIMSTLCYAVQGDSYFSLSVWIKPTRTTIQKKATWQYFQLLLYKMVVTINSVDKTPI